MCRRADLPVAGLEVARQSGAWKASHAATESVRSTPRPEGRVSWLAGAFPLAGHVPAIATDLLGLLRHAERTLGPMFWINTGAGHAHLFCMQREVFEAFRSGPLSTDHLRDFGRGFFGDGLLVQDGPKHRHIRSAMNHPFTPKGLGDANMGELLASAVERRVRRWVGRRGVPCSPRPASWRSASSSR